jgi:DNA-binding CsgD family transcriptional regulator
MKFQEPVKSPITYLNILEEAKLAKVCSDTDEIIYLLSKMEHLSSIPFSSLSSFFILDYSKRNYHVVADAVIRELGYSVDELLEGGVDFLFDVFHPNDLLVYSEDVMKNTRDLLKNQSLSNYFFSCNYRVKAKDKRYVQILQHGSYIADPVTGTPLYSFGNVSNITPFKTDNSMTLVVEEHIRTPKALQKRTISIDNFFPEPDEAILSRREREVLCRIADGLTTKEIAQKLNISINTVFNHRRNMFRKTNSRNVVDIIRYALEHRII